MEEVATAAAAASGKNKDKTSPAVIVCVVSLLFALFAARTLCHLSSGEGEEEVVSAVVWALSPSICAYLFFWAALLSGPTATVAGVMSLLVRATFLPLLADAATHLVTFTPCAGAAAMFLATVYSAIKVGRALSFWRQRAGTERTAITAAATSAPSYRSHAEDEHDRPGCGVVVGMLFFVGMPFVIMSLVAWSSEPQIEIDGNAVLGLFMLGAGPFLLVMRHLQLEGRPLQANDEDFVWSMVCAVIGCVVVAGVAGAHVGTIASVLVVWAGALVMAGIFGYGRALEAQYERLAAIKRNEPPTAQDASGLLVGRDEEDACSAHIDASTSLCLDCVFPRLSKCNCATGSHRCCSC